MSNVNCENVNGCYGCYWSFGLKNCKAVYKSLFSIKQFGAKYILFNKQADENRYQEVWNKLQKKLNGWFPKQTNAYDLYNKAGEDWSKIDVYKLTYIPTFEESYKDMPQEAIDYLTSLPEFDADVFKQITGLDSNKEKMVKVEISESTLKELKKSGIKVIN